MINMHRALLVEVDYQSGRRAGGVDPRDANLQSYGWQSLPGQDGPSVEIRVVEDDRDLSDYRSAAGVRVLEGEEEINKAIEKYIPTRLKADEAELREWMRNQAVEPGHYWNGNEGDRRKRLERIRDDGGPVREVEPKKVEDVSMGGRGNWGNDLGLGNGVPE